MHIKIAERLKPYSHLPGTYLMLPKSVYRCQIFPTLLRVDDLSKPIPATIEEIQLPLTGPISDFTIVQDLEKQQILVWGKSPEGHFRYSIKNSDDQSIIVQFEKHPKELVSFTIQSKSPVRKFSVATSGERLSLGNHKAQDWELIRRRSDFAEIFPLWHRLGSLIEQPDQTCSPSSGTLLGACKNAINAGSPELILAQFQSLFLTGFHSALSPRTCDDDFNGLALPPLEANRSPLDLISCGAQLIRSLFFQEQKEQLSLLPALPPEFHCGRFIDITCANQGLLSIEWTKKAMRCFTFSSSIPQKLTFQFCRGEKSCRLRVSHKDRGIVYVSGSQLDIQPGVNYWFDNFVR